MRHIRTWLRCGLLALLAWQAVPGLAEPLQDLLAEGHLQIDSAIAPTDMLVPGQKATLTLQIATDRWFAGGTRISIPEVPGLVILQTEQFASNASENRDGQSWVVQRWTLDVFPQRAGDFSIPPIRLQLKVNAGEAGNIEGELYSQPTQFSAIVPESLAQAQQWVAAPVLRVRQSFDRSLEDLQVGDAFEREVIFEATDVMAMMLPTFAAEELTGLAAYPSPPELDNSNNRGQSSARRSQRISYVVQAEGEYLLEAREFFWWDTQSSELQLLSLPEIAITVGTGAAVIAHSGFEFKPRTVLALLAGLVLFTSAIWLCLKYLPRLPAGRIAAASSSLWQQLRDLRKPALPRRLNPDSSAGD